MAGISSKASAFGDPKNKYLFNAATELNTDLDLQYYETPFRSYDPQIGMFRQPDPMADMYAFITPYQFAFNNPLLYNDPTGAITESDIHGIINDLLNNNDHGGHGGRWTSDGKGGGSTYYFDSDEEAFASGASYAYFSGYWGSGQDAINGYTEAAITFNGLTGSNKEWLIPVQVRGYYNNQRDWITTNMDEVNAQLKANGAFWEGGESGVTPWQVGWEWLTGTGPRHRDFTNGDYFTEQLRQHDHIANVRAQIPSSISKNQMFGYGNYELVGIQGVGKYIKDYSTLLTGGLTGNIAVTYLGSYDLKWSVIGISGNLANIQFTVENSSTMQSASRPPVIGYEPWWQNSVGAAINSYFSTGWGSKTTQSFIWTETIKLR